MKNKYIRVKELREELGITQKGLDNALNRKEIKKQYPFEKGIPYLFIEDAEIIKKHITNNGRVKAIIDRDKKDLELEQKYLTLKEKYCKISDDIVSLNNKLKDNEDTIRELKEDKESFKKQIDHLHEQQNKYQERLEEANKLLLLEKAESDKFKKLYIEHKQQLLLLEEDKESLISEKNTMESTLKNITIEKEIALTRADELETKLKEEVNTKEILINENNKYKNMKLKDKIKFLFTK